PSLPPALRRSAAALERSPRPTLPRSRARSASRPRQKDTCGPPRYREEASRLPHELGQLPDGVDVAHGEAPEEGPSTQVRANWLSPARVPRAWRKIENASVPSIS